MTLKEIEAIEKTVLTPADVAPYLGTDPNSIRGQAQTAPDRLGFPVIVEGSRVKIPKDAFVFFCRYGRPVLLGGKPDWHSPEA